MKQLLTKILLFSFLMSYPQDNNFSWLNKLKYSNNKKINYNEVVKEGNKYWETHNKNIKGSGYKPFKRWETHWYNYVDENGFLPTTYELFDTWSKENKLNRLSNQSVNDQSNWISLGPTDFLNRQTSYLNLGRINCVTPHPNNSNIIFAGAPSGGIWKSIDGGLTYIPLSDNLPQIGVSSIAVDYNNPNIIYIATGDDDAGDS